MKSRFLCEGCGMQVPFDAASCPYCHKEFKAVRCPVCGLVGRPEQFLSGCPSCGYLMSNELSLPPSRRKKKKKRMKYTFERKKKRRSAVPLIVYRFAGVVIFILLVIIVFLYIRSLA
ncbi:MAG: zinc ribbon domain-containing protein [Spirochaetales bacterium]|nr:zinc ribbon domain-containing protein [Spirochaetales bacterium]